jgi:hypothetical protein
MTKSLYTVATQDPRSALVAEFAGRDEIRENVFAVEVSDAASCVFAQEVLVDVLKRRDELTAQEKAATGPISLALREIRSWFRPMLDLLGECETDLKRKIGAYDVGEKSKREALIRQAQQAQQRGDQAGLVKALNLAAAPVETPKGTSVREVWRVIVFRPELVPYEFLCVDEAKIKAHVKGVPANQTPSPIPGVRFEKETLVAQRRVI